MQAIWEWRLFFWIKNSFFSRILSYENLNILKCPFSHLILSNACCLLTKWKLQQQEGSQICICVQKFIVMIKEENVSTDMVQSTWECCVYWFFCSINFSSICFWKASWKSAPISACRFLLYLFCMAIVCNCPNIQFLHAISYNILW